MEINYKDIGVLVKQERINKNITQEKLAELSGVSVTHMSNIENANTKLSLPVLINIANATLFSITQSCMNTDTAKCLCI